MEKDKKKEKKARNLNTVENGIKKEKKKKTNNIFVCLFVCLVGWLSFMAKSTMLAYQILNPVYINILNIYDL